MAIHKFHDHLYQVDLDQNLEGFRQFISAWIYIHNDIVLVVDPGPSATIPILVDAFAELGINKISLILLTHIHIDHAGGTGLLLKKYPDAKVNCHSIAIPHLINPDKLWKGSLQVLGHIAEAYGYIPPVPEQNLFSLETIKLDGLQIQSINTPGHASHHLCYQLDKILFAGEVAGVIVPTDKEILHRAATPPVFNYEIYKDSLRKASKLEAELICFGHYGAATQNDNVFTKAEKQLDLWCGLCSSHNENYSDQTIENIFKSIEESDDEFKNYANLPEDIKVREEYFTKNSIKGMLDYYRKLDMA